MIEVTYIGPAGTWRCEEDGTEYVLPHGVAVLVPESLVRRFEPAENFDFHESPESELPEVGPEEDPDGVNADDPYGED